MAKCDLSIELDDPKSVHAGGSKITGVVRVRVDKQVTTKGLEVTSGWATHGRGNVTSGTFETQTLFQGEWQAGDQLEYRFELPVGQWPPSYHGNYLNIDHYITARAKIPWAFDPKAKRAFLMRPSGGAEVANVESNVIELSGPLGCIFVSIFVGIFGAVFVGVLAAGGPSIFLVVLTILGLIGFLFYAFRVLMPRYLLGNVEAKLQPAQVSPGEEVTGEIMLRPRKNVNINAITMTFKACERVVSGSGSNRTTHNNVFYEKETTLVEKGVLPKGEEHRIPLSIQLPGDAPYTVDLTDNDIIWTARLRIDIPRWPDWTKEIPIKVVPSGNEPIATTETTSEQIDAEPTEESTITFAETAQHIYALRNDADSVEELVDAVSGLTFDMQAFVERRLLYSGDDDPHLYDDGYAVWAHYTDPELPLVMYVPHEMADEFEQAGRDLWQGRGTIVGWDRDHRRLQVKVEVF